MKTIVVPARSFMAHPTELRIRTKMNSAYLPERLIIRLLWGVDFKSLIFKSWVPRNNFRQPNSRIKRFSTWVAEILILVHVPSI